MSKNGKVEELNKDIHIFIPATFQLLLEELLSQSIHSMHLRTDGLTLGFLLGTFYLLKEVILKRNTGKRDFFEIQGCQKGLICRYGRTDESF